MERIRTLLKRYREVIFYLVFGVLTTLVNIVCYYLLARVGGLDVTFSTAVAWVVSVIFAYLTNRKWVFQSKAAGAKSVLYEIGTFFGGRAFSGLLDVGIMFLFVEVLNWNDMLIKICSNVIVVILNYIISKLIVFRKKA